MFASRKQQLKKQQQVARCLASLLHRVPLKTYISSLSLSLSSLIQYSIKKRKEEPENPLSVSVKMSTTANTSTSSGGGGGGGGGGNNINSSSSSGGGGSGSGSTGSPCGACKFLRRKCVNGCIFAPYFDSEQGATQFAAVHKVFGASNVSKLLLFIPVHRRLDAVVTICYEAQARLRDPVYGCVAHIFALQQQVMNLQAELSYLQAHLATLELPSPPPAPTIFAPSAFSIANLPSAATVTTSLDLSTLFDPLVQPPWTMLQQPWRQTTDNPSADQGGGEGGDLQTLARELLHRQRSLMVSSPSAEPSVPTSSPPAPTSL